MDKYRGSITTTGTSEAIRLDKPFFRAHPEFSQKAKVRAHVLGRGTVLISLLEEEKAPAQEDDDPVVGAFLSFLESDMMRHPERIASLAQSRIADAVDLTTGVSVSDDDEIPDDVDF